MITDTQETTTNYIRGDQCFNLFSSEPKWIRKIHMLVDQHPDEVKIEYENEDGSLCASVPIKWFKVSPPRRVSEEQKEKASLRFKKMWDDKKNNEE